MSRDWTFQGEARMDSSRETVNWFWPAVPESSVLKPLGSSDRVGRGVWMLPRAENYVVFPADLLLV